MNKPTDKLYIHKVQGPPNTKKIYNQYDDMCCEGDEETYFVLEDGTKHGPHVWEYGYERIINYYNHGELTKTEYYDSLKKEKFYFTLVKTKKYDSKLQK